VLLTDIVHCAYVGMVETGYCTSFALKTLSELRSCRGIRTQQLKGNEALEPGVECAVDFADTARSDGSDDLVGPEPSSSGDGHMI
jgi:hypothetical protein